MTDSEIKAIRFKWQSHMSMEGEHTTCYVSECGRFGICEHVPYKDGHPHGRPYTHYRIGNKIYKTKEKFIEALMEL